MAGSKGIGLPSGLSRLIEFRWWRGGGEGVEERPLVIEARKTANHLAFPLAFAMNLTPCEHALLIQPVFYPCRRSILICIRFVLDSDQIINVNIK